jgi:hypothetical protein
MFLIPEPKQIKINKGNFILSRSTEIILDSLCDFKDFKAARMLQKEIEKLTGITVKVNKAFSANKPEGSIYLKKCSGEGVKESYTLDIKENGIELCGNDQAGLFYAIQTLTQIIRQQRIILDCVSIEDKPHFKDRGFFHDVTRGKVPTLQTLKELVDRLAFYKINQLQLYIEHTFAFKNFSEVWMGKSPITAEEILELDAYCAERNVELVPSLSTFGHLYEILITKSYSHLCELDNSEEQPFTWYDRQMHHTLDVSNEESFEFVKSMLEEFIPLFSSNKFNICCDETFDIGKGKTKELAEKVGTSRLYVDFLNKIISFVKDFDKEILFWGDIIVKCPEYLKEIPKDVICINWAYNADVTEDDTRTISESGIKQYVCPGVGGWNRLMNVFDNAFVNISKMINYGQKYNAIGVLNTDWGDYGHINLFANSIPGMIVGAELSWNPDDKRKFEDFNEAISLLEYGDSSKKIMTLLTELSQCEVASWAFLVWWKEQKILNNGFLDENIKQFRDMDVTKATKGYYRALEIEKEIASLVYGINENRKLDMKEFMNSARGIALMNAACILINQHEFKSEEVKEVVGGYELAAQLEYWFEAFSALWRTRNKESELYRIKDMIILLCKYFRSIS